LKTVRIAKRRLITREHPFLRELLGQRSPLTFEKILRKTLRLRTREERKALLYYRSLDAPLVLDTEDSFVDDELLAGLIRIRAQKPRWEAAWHLCGDIRVAPDFPLVFANNRFVPGSAGFDEDVAISIWRNYARRLMGRPTIRVDHAILLRDFWDRNYWHLLHDLLPRLVMAEAIDLDPTIPVVVSEDLMKFHGERLQGTPFLNGRAVIVQPHGHTLCCKELFLLRPGEFARHWAREVVARIPAEPPVAPGSRYIYCCREPEFSGGRTAENNFEIEEIFRSAGFSIVSPASMTLIQQKGIFEHAEVITGINGAAFANALFRYDKRLTIGALIASNFMSTTFPTMAKVFGFGYGGFVVPSVSDNWGSSVVVPPDTARRLIEWVLNRTAAFDSFR
jgi:Glycosyltransferase 61